MNSGTYDTVVVGGGVVGMSLAYGLRLAGERVCVLDEGDDAFRASRGNFGLVWVQGKGLGCPAYTRWTMDAARRWPAFAQDLMERTSVDVELSQIGGLSICLSDDELAGRAATLETVRREVGGDYPFEVLGHNSLRELSPHIGPAVTGAVFCPLDGHVNPLRLLRSLVQGFEALGGKLLSSAPVDRIEYRGGGFQVAAGGAVHATGKIVLAAGLGNLQLAPLVGLRAPVRPVRGQVLVSERVKPFLRHPAARLRQTGEGSVQIGDSKEEVGLDDGTTLAQLALMADRATRCFPLLEEVNIVRAWGSLRVMSPDGLPIYQASKDFPGAFVVTCHSGITLAAQHAGPLVDWIRGAAAPTDITGFKAERFDVQTH